MSRLQELEKNSKVSAFLKAQKEAAGKGLDLASLLIMPVQVRAVSVASCVFVNLGTCVCCVCLCANLVLVCVSACASLVPQATHMASAARTSISSLVRRVAQVHHGGPPRAEGAQRVLRAHSQDSRGAQRGHAHRRPAGQVGAVAEVFHRLVPRTCARKAYRQRRRQAQGCVGIRTDTDTDTAKNAAAYKVDAVPCMPLALICARSHW